MIAIYNYGQVDNNDIFARMAPKYNVEQTVADIIDDVRKNGDDALRRYTEKFDGVLLDSLEVSPAEFDEAMAQTEPEFIAIIEKAAVNIRRFHEQQTRSNFIVEGE